MASQSLENIKMSLKCKLNNTAPVNNVPMGDQMISTHVPIPYAPVGMPPGIPQLTVCNTVRARGEAPPLALPGSNLQRAVNYYADYGGCGFWRMIFPELLLNGNQRAIINGLTTMVLDPRFYQGIRAVRLQRQATPMQLQFVNFLKQVSQQHDYKIIYEVDDIIFKDDIPDFNRCKVAFEDPTILKSALEMMQLSDEMTVTCDYMKQYYIEKTGNKKITVVPNYPPRMWADGRYNEADINKRYNKFKKKPRVGYCGSGTHIDVVNKTGQNDDFTHIVNHIIRTRKDYQWVMMGCFPLPLKPYIDNGDIEFAPWAMMFDYPRAMQALNLNATIAPLMDCHFNRAKSNIKFLEAACQGIPGVYQNLCTYSDAPLKFTSGNELVDQLGHLLKDETRYMKYSKQSRDYADTMWLDDHLDEYMEAYYTKYGDPSRKALLKYNPEQAAHVL